MAALLSVPLECVGALSFMARSKTPGSYSSLTDESLASVEPATAEAPRLPARWCVSNVLIGLGVAIFGGAFGVFGALLQEYGGSHLVVAVFIAPAVEEIMKPMGLVFLLEKAPHRVISEAQVFVTAALGGLGFAVLENLIYLHVYIPLAPTPASFDVAAFRWTVCTALHVGCSSIVGLGLAREFRRYRRTGARLELERILPFYATAAVVHGVYNGVVGFLV